MIYVASDLHLVKYKDGNTYINEPAYEHMLKWKPLTENEQLIYLGDLMDAEIQPENTTAYDLIFNQLKNKISASSYNIFIRGNNDTLPDSFYKSIGFNKVIFATMITIKNKKILLSHTSVELINDNVHFNLHGHIHRPGVNPDMIPYYHPCSNNINLCTKDLREYDLTPLGEINFVTEKYRNRMYDGSQNEKPGMSQFVANMARDFLNHI